jgi:uncharacterized repeat protein (TIGR01451 family)
VLLAVGASPSFAVTLTPTDAPLPGSNFQGGDGNQDNPAGDVSSPADGVNDIDWQSLSSTPGNVDSTNPDMAFSGGDKESEPGSWSFVDEGAGVNPSKDNLLGAWSNSAPSVSGPPNTYLYLAFTREAQTGNTFSTFELNQRAETWNNGQATIACRTTGDLLISYEVASGGSPPNVDVIVYRWIADTSDSVTGCSKTGHFETLDPQPFAEAAVNGTDINNYLSKPPFGDTFLEGTFGEAALNLTGIFEDANLNPCQNFGQISMHTRSSTSIDSQLQDYISPVPVVVRSCSLAIHKEGTSPHHDGDSEGFTYTVTNDGTVPVTVSKSADAGVTDDKCSAVTYVSGDTDNDGQVDLSETWTFTCTYTVNHLDENASHDIVNTATVHGTVGQTPVTKSDTYTTHVIHPAIDVTKVANKATVHVGDTITYTVTVTNTGDTSLTVTPADTGCTGFDSSSFSLTPGETKTLTCTHVATAGDGASYSNTACATGVDEIGGAKGTVSDCDTASTTIIHPGIDVTKTAAETAVHVGDTIHYTVTVKNTGDTSLTVTPADTGCTGFDSSSFSLTPGETKTLTCTHVATAGDGASYTNQACATGVDSVGGDKGTVSDCDSAEVDIYHPAIDVTKTAAETAVHVGDTIHYTITVRNTGDVNLSVTPSDLGCSGFDNSAFTLAVGDTKTLTCTHVAADADGASYNNKACADGVDPLETTVSDCDTVTTPVIHPATVSGVKFHDLDGDGAAREGGEGGLAGWTFYVDYNGNGTQDAGEPSATSGADGSWTIGGIRPGTYAVREVGRAGWTCSFPATCEYDLTFKSSDAKTGADFGNWEPASVSGSKYQDTNNNGAQDAGEGPLQGFTFYVDYNGNGTLDTGEPAGVSGADGKWTITGVKPGTFNVLEVANPNFTCTQPASTCGYQVTFQAGDNQTGKVFGNAPPAQIVEPIRITPGSARLAGPTGCQARAFNARIRGSKIATVTFVLDGKVVKKVTNTKNATLIQLRINPSKLKLGVHRLVVNVTFQSSSGTKPKTYRLSFQRCAKKLIAPRFTG